MAELSLERIGKRAQDLADRRKLELGIELERDFSPQARADFLKSVPSLIKRAAEEHNQRFGPLSAVYRELAPAMVRIRQEFYPDAGAVFRLDRYERFSDLGANVYWIGTMFRTATEFDQDGKYNRGVALFVIGTDQGRAESANKPLIKPEINLMAVQLDIHDPETISDLKQIDLMQTREVDDYGVIDVTMHDLLLRGIHLRALAICSAQASQIKVAGKSDLWIPWKRGGSRAYQALEDQLALVVSRS